MLKTPSLLRALSLIAALCLLAQPVTSYADSTVVQNCGTPPAPYAVGGVRPDTMDTTGTRCGPGGTRPIQVIAAMTMSAAYAAGNNIGGIITINTGLPANTPVIIDSAAVNVFVATATATTGMTFMWFGALPGGTFTDAATPTMIAADALKLRTAVNTGAATDAAPTANVILSWRMGTATGALNVDASGRLYIVLLSIDTTTLTSPSNAQVVVGLRW